MSGFSALSLAARAQQWEVFDQLMQAGATLTPDALIVLVEFSRETEEIRRHLGEADAKARSVGQTTLLHACVANGHIPTEAKLEMMSGLLNRGVEVDARNIGGKTALGVACNNGPVEVVRLLLERNADPNQLSEGRPLLLEARSIEILKALLEHGATPEAVHDGKSVLGHLSSEWLGNERTQVLELMMKHMTKDAGARR